MIYILLQCTCISSPYIHRSKIFPC